MRQQQGDLIEKTLKRQLEADGYDLVDLVQIPNTGDRMVRIQTLEEALQEFDQGGPEDMTGFLIHVRPKSKAPAAQPGARERP